MPSSDADFDFGAALREELAHARKDLYMLSPYADYAEVRDEMQSLERKKGRCIMSLAEIRKQSMGEPNVLAE